MEAKFDDALPSMMETVVLVPAQLQVCPGPGLVAATSLAPGLSLGPHTGHLQQLILPPFPLLGSLDPKHRFGLHDEIKQVSSQQSPVSMLCIVMCRERRAASCVTATGFAS